MIESLVGGVMATLIFFAIVHAFVKAALGPVHEKLDRLLAIHEALDRKPREP
jgi:hypothetical protein